MANETENETKRILLELPMNLYDQFVAWKAEQGCVTDAEGIRAAIRKAIEPNSTSLGTARQG